MPSDTRYLKSADSAFKPSSAKGRKDGRHTVKVQYTVNTNGLIVHSTRHFPGRVHDVKVYRMKHPTLPSGLPSRDGSDGKEEKARVWVYMDRGYPGGVPEPAKEVRPDQQCRLRAGKPKVAVAGRTGSLTEMGLKSMVGRLEK